jgi:hypothetical protein
MNKIILFLFLISGLSTQAQLHLRGIIYDSTSHEILPFVNIAVKGTSIGTSSTLSGKFDLMVSSVPVVLVFSYVGYEKKEWVVEKDGFYKIYLKNSGIELYEATVFSGPNPALLIMEKVIRNRDLNNPEKNCQFQYTSYNKMIFTIEADSLILSNKINSGTINKDDKETLEFMEKQHIFLMESVTEKKYASKNKNKETIKASKISGFNSPAFSLLSTQLQSFHFYHDEISLGETKYVGPISKAGLNHYQYILKDTFFLEKDTVYSIAFYPKKEKDERSMKGVLQIHTDRYAIYNVISEPAVSKEKGFGIKVSQQYRKINNEQWFPEVLNSKILLYEVQIEGFSMIGLSYGKIENIVINPNFSKKDFDEIELNIDKEIEKISSENLNRYRTDSLSIKEIETYRIVDSIGKANRLDKKILALQSLFLGHVPIKFIDWDITKLINYNDYEGMRLGLALRSNHKISKYFSFGGYIAYGFTDRAWKYGGDLNINFSQRKQIELNFSIQQDVESGSTIPTFEKNRYLLSQGYSNLFLNRFDSVLKYESRLSFRLLKHFKVTPFTNYQFRSTFKNYQYVTPLNESISFLDDEYELTETGIEIKMALNEKFIETPFGFLSKGTKYPTLLFRYTKGWSGIYNSEYDYQRITLKSNYTISSITKGTFYFSVVAGITTGNAPYHLLFNPTGTYKPIQKLTFFSMDGFETMRLNEFLANQFASLHFRYRLPKPIINLKKFQPLLSFTNSMIYGQFNETNRHQNLEFSELNKIYTESGIVLDNLLKSNGSGFGIGFFYRWGHYQLPTFKENFAIKISISTALF